jgi:hypothetical protein
MGLKITPGATIGRLPLSLKTEREVDSEGRSSSDMREHRCTDACIGRGPGPKRPCSRCSRPADYGEAVAGPNRGQTVVACPHCGFVQGVQYGWLYERGG